MLSKLPSISVIVITYNHERFIINTLQRIFDQDFEGNIEIIVSDDFSTDQTAKKIKSWLDSLPHRQNREVNFLENCKNIGATNNFVQAYDTAKYDLIALCEGDDYWSDKRKVSKQVPYFDDPKIGYVCSGYVIEDGKGKREIRLQHARYSLREYLITQPNVQTLTVMFRKPNGDIYPHFVNKKYLGSTYLVVRVLLEFEQLQVIDDCTATYVWTGSGVWTSATSLKKIIWTCVTIVNYFWLLVCFRKYALSLFAIKRLIQVIFSAIKGVLLKLRA